MNKLVAFFLIAISVFLSTEVVGQNVNKIEFSKTDTSLKGCEIVYSDFQKSKYLDSLRRTFEIDKVVKDCKTDMEKVFALLDWTHRQWKHNGLNEPKKGDAISILSEVRGGKQFRCVEYGVVLAATLNSIGVTARIIGLKTKNVETRESGAGHVATEAYLSDLNKWIFIDPQMNLVPTLNNLPLNAVELNKALCDSKKSVKYINKSGVINFLTAKRYNKWILPYLFYFDVIIDNRYGVERSNRLTCKGKRSLMLVPVGVKNPAVFQIKYPIDYCLYTNCLDVFYSNPKTE